MEKPIKSDPNFRPEKRKRFEMGSQWNVDRNYGQYQFFLGMDFKDMIGKKVLDIGSGEGEEMPKQVAKMGVEVISISPDFRNGITENQKEAGLLDGWQKRTAAASAQDMPFRDNTFDYELALYSVPMYLPPVVEEYERCFNEIIRTLKPGGKAYIFPIPGWSNGEINPDIQEVLDRMAGATYSPPEYQRSNKGINYRIVITKNYA